MRQYHETFQRQIGGKSLALRLPLLCVAGLQKNPGITARSDGAVEISGDVETRQAFENHFLDDVGFSVNTASNSGIQRTGVIGQTADERQKRFSNQLFPALRVRDAANFGDRVLPPLQLLLGNLVHPSEKRILGGLLSNERGEVEKRATQKRDGRPFHSKLVWSSCSSILSIVRQGEGIQGIGSLFRNI